MVFFKTPAVCHEKLRGVTSGSVARRHPASILAILLGTAHWPLLAGAGVLLHDALLALGALQRLAADGSALHHRVAGRPDALHLLHLAPGAHSAQDADTRRSAAWNNRGTKGDTFTARPDYLI